MKREIPVYQYNDAWQILARSNDNGVVIDAASEEIMLRIEQAMSRLTARRHGRIPAVA